MTKPTHGAVPLRLQPMHEPIVHLFEQRFGALPQSILEVAGDGSQRRYFRLVGEDMATAVGAIGPDPEENRAFFAFSEAFRSIGLPVPEIYGRNDAARVWLLEDLGDTTLFSALSAAREAEGGLFPDSMRPVYERVVELLPRFQVLGGRVVDYNVAYPRAAFDRQSILWDLNYFKYHFLKLAHVPFNEQRLENDFQRLADFLLAADTSHFLYRDFQSRNIMLREHGPWFIDYQGGRRGAPHYDIASLLYDAKAAIPESVREDLLTRYLHALSQYVAVNEAEFREQFRGYVLVRIMQAMGAYGYRGFFERKARFLQSVPYAARNIELILARGLPVRLPELESVFGRIVDLWADRQGEIEPRQGLTVHVTSFSYRRGYPDDAAGHGGGFVFDCRALSNPGRHLEYADQCGRDADVVEYIESYPEVERFWQSVRGLVEAQVREYQRRGFQSLTVNFGCTGGQHRSVYLAERLTRHLRDHFEGVSIDLVHREEPYWKGRLREPGTPDSEPLVPPAVARETSAATR